MNGDLAWNVNQRIDEIIKCDPDLVFLLIGSNDAMGSLSKDAGEFYKIFKSEKKSNNITFHQHYFWR